MTQGRQPKPDYTFGDLVHVAGYFPRVFKVDGYRREDYFYPDETWTDLVYELHDVTTGEWLEADEDDLTSADGAEAPTELTGIDIFGFLGGADVYAFLDNEGEAGIMAKQEPRKPTARELSGQEAERRKQARKERAAKVDALLDEYNDAKVLAEMFADDDEYKAKVEYLTRKLAEISEE